MELLQVVTKHAFTTALTALVPAVVLLKISERNMARLLPEACNTILDDEFPLLPAKTHSHLACMGSIGREMYFDYFAFDLVLFPIIYTTVFVGAMTRLWPQQQGLLVFPVVTVAADLVENFSLSFLLSAFPARYAALEVAICVATATKFACIIATMLVILMGMIKTITSGPGLKVKGIDADTSFAAAIGALVPSFSLITMLEKSMVRVLPGDCNTLLDASFFLSSDAIYPHLECMGVNGRAMHLDFYLFDLVIFPVIYSTVVAGALTRLWPSLRGIWLPPVLAAVVDLVENACICFVFTQFPSRHPSMETAISILTRTKWTFAFMGILLVVSGAARTAFVSKDTKREVHKKQA